MILAAPLVIPFAKAVGISVATLGMAKAADMVNDYIEANPEESMKILSTIVPSIGIGQVFMNKEKISLEDLDEMTDEEAQDLSKEEKAELMKQAGKSGGSNKRQTMIDISEKLGLSGEGKEKQDIEYDIDERYDEGGVEEVSKPKFDYKKFFRNRRADGGRIGFNLGGSLTGPALNIYNSMSAAGYFTDDEIRNAITAAGYEIPGASQPNQTTTVQDVINQNANPSGSKLERALLNPPGKLKEQYKAQLNNPISNAIYDFKENMTTKLSDPTTKIGKLGINASNVLGSAIGAIAGIPGLGFILDKLNAGSTFDRGAIRELNAPMQLGIYNPDKTGTGYFTQGPIQPGISSLSDTYKSGLTDGQFAGVTVDDLGRIQQTGDYNTAENVMAGYNAGFDLGATAFDRYDKIDDTIEKEKNKANVNYAKIKSLQKRQQALTDFALANAAAQRKAKQAAIDRAIARGNKEAEERARVKSITAGYGGHDDSPGATGPTAAGAGMGVGGGYASDYGFLKDGGLATMFKERR